MSSSVSDFKRERGISLEMLKWERASSGVDGGTLWFYSSCGSILELRWELREPLLLPQGSPISI